MLQLKIRVLLLIQFDHFHKYKQYVNDLSNSAFPPDLYCNIERITY